MKMKNEPGSNHTGEVKAALVLFFEQNPHLDIKNCDLTNANQTGLFTWQGLSAHKEVILHELKKYQRLLRIVDDKSVVEKLLAQGIHSAYQIAVLTEELFLEKYGLYFNNIKEAGAAYTKACRRKAQIMLNYVNKREKQSPYIKAARFFHDQNL